MSRPGLINTTFASQSVAAAVAEDEREEQRHRQLDSQHLLATVLAGISNQLAAVAHTAATCSSPEEMQQALALVANSTAASASAGDPAGASVAWMGQSQSMLIAPSNSAVGASGVFDNNASMYLASPILGGGPSSPLSAAQITFQEVAQMLRGTPQSPLTPAGGGNSGDARRGSVGHQHQHHQHHHGRALTAAETHSLSSFVSDAAMRCVVGRDSTGLPVFKPRRVMGAVLFVDISGYSKVATALGANGNKGAHALNQAVNSVFSSVTSIVREEQGDTCSFLGDACLAIFVDRFRTAHGDRRSCLRAVRTALKLQRKCGSYAIPSYPDLEFHLHIGVSYGQLECDVIPALASKGQRAYPLLEGQPLCEIGRIVDSAQKGEITVSALVKCHTDDVINYTTTPPETVTPTAAAAAAATAGSVAAGSSSTAKPPLRKLPEGVYMVESIDEEEANDALEAGSDLAWDKEEAARIASLGSSAAGRRASGSNGNDDDDDDDDFSDLDDPDRHLLDDADMFDDDDDCGMRGEEGQDAGPAPLEGDSSAETDDALGKSTRGEKKLSAAEQRRRAQALRYPRQLSRTARPRDPETESLFIQPVVFRRLKNGLSLEHQSEMRFIATLFIKKESSCSTRDWINEIRRILEPHAPIVQCISDDKGVSVVAAINMLTAEQHPADRAVTVAAALLEQECGVRIGMAVGSDVLAGVVGGEVARRWDVTGGSVVRAARLMQHAAKTGIPLVVDKSIVNSLSDTTRVRHIGAIDIKGSAGASDIYTLARSRGTFLTVLTDVAPHTPSTLVHLDVQKILLREHIELADPVQQTTVAIVTGGLLSGKKGAVLSALDRAAAASRANSIDCVLCLKHMCSGHEEPLAIATSIAGFFRFSPNERLARLARDLYAAQQKSHVSHSMTLLLRLCTELIAAELRVAIIVQSAQSMDETSLSFIRELLKMPVVFRPGTAGAAAAAAATAASAASVSNAMPTADSGAGLSTSMSMSFVQPSYAFGGAGAGASTHGFRRRRADVARGRVSFFLTHTPFIGSSSAGDIRDELLRGVVKRVPPVVKIVLLPSELSPADCRSVFRAVGGFGADSALQHALAHLSGRVPSFVAGFTAHMVRNNFFTDVAGAAANGSSEDIASLMIDPFRLIAPGYVKLEQRAAMWLVDGRDRSDGSEINRDKSRLRPYWRHMTERMYARCVFQYDRLPPRLQLVCRVLAALEFNQELKRYVRGVPKPVLVATLRRLQGGGPMDVTSFGAPAAGPAEAPSSSSSARAQKQQQQQQRAGSSSGGGRTSSPSSPSTPAAAAAADPLTRHILRDLEKLCELFILAETRSPLLTCSDTCISFRLPPLIEAVYALLPQDTLRLYNRRAAAATDAYFTHIEASPSAAPPGGHAAGGSMSAPQHHNSFRSSSSAGRVLETHYESTTMRRKRGATMVGGSGGPPSAVPVAAASMPVFPSSQRPGSIVTMTEESSGSGEHSPPAAAAADDAAGGAAAAADAGELETMTSRAVQLIALTQMYFRAGQREKAAETLAAGWLHALDEYAGATDSEEFAVIAYRYSNYALLLMPNATPRDLVRFFFSHAEYVQGASSTTAEQQQQQEKVYDPKAEERLPSKRYYDAYWLSRHHPEKHARFSPQVRKASSFVGPVALGSVGGVLTLVARNTVERYCRSVCLRTKKRIFLHLHTKVDRAGFLWLAAALRCLDDVIIQHAMPAAVRRQQQQQSGGGAAAAAAVEKLEQQLKLATYQQQLVQQRELECIEAVMKENESEEYYAAALERFEREITATTAPRRQALREFVVTRECEELCLSLYRSATLNHNATAAMTASAATEASARSRSSGGGDDAEAPAVAMQGRSSGAALKDIAVIFDAILPFLSRRMRRLAAREKSGRGGDGSPASESSGSSSSSTSDADAGADDLAKRGSGGGGGANAVSAAASASTAESAAAQKILLLQKRLRDRKRQGAARSMLDKAAQYEASRAFENFEKSIMALAHGGFWASIPAFPGLTLRLVRDAVVANSSMDMLDYRCLLFSFLLVRTRVGRFEGVDRAAEIEEQDVYEHLATLTEIAMSTERSPHHLSALTAGQIDKKSASTVGGAVLSDAAATTPTKFVPMKPSAASPRRHN